MKICHVTSVHKPDDTRIFHKECISLAKAGYETYLVVCGESGEKSGVHIVGTGTQSKSRLKRMRVDTKRAYKAALSIDADIYHFHDPELLPFAVKMKKRGKKVIFDSHELYPEVMSVKTYIPKCLRKIVSRLYERTETKSVKNLDAVIFPCKIRGKHPFEGRCMRTVFIDNFPIINADVQYPEPIENSVCYIGSLTYDRGITTIVKAAYAAGVKLVLAGTFGSQKYKDEVMSMPEAKCVEYLGQIPQETVRDVISKSKIGLCVLRNTNQYSIINNFATKVFDYWLAGRPVILSNTDFNVRTISKMKSGICVDPDDVNQVSQAITYLSAHTEEAAKMAENGKRAVFDEYSWSHEEKTLVGLYDELKAEVEGSSK